MNGASQTVTMLVDPGGSTVNATLGGAEIPRSRAEADFTGLHVCSLRFQADVLAVSVRVEYSINGGADWSTLVSNFAALAANATNQSGAAPIPAEARVKNVALRALAVGLVASTFHVIQLEAM